MNKANVVFSSRCFEAIAPILMTDDSQSGSGLPESKPSESESMQNDLSEAIASDSSPQSTRVTPLRCFTGAMISAPIAFALYKLTVSIAQTFAEKPVVSHSAMAVRLSVMVRTLVVGMGALGTGIFALTSLGVVALGIQLLFQSKSSEQV